MVQLTVRKEKNNFIVLVVPLKILVLMDVLLQTYSEVCILSDAIYFSSKVLFLEDTFCLSSSVLWILLFGGICYKYEQVVVGEYLKSKNIE